MKRKLQKLFTGAAVFSLAFSFLPPLLSASGQTSRKVEVSSAGVEVIITEAPTRGRIVNNSRAFGNSKGTWLCETALTESGVAVQGQAGINLNQPADCFNLVAGEVFAPRIDLAVKPLSVMERKIVSLPSARLANDYYKLPSALPNGIVAFMVPIFAALAFFIAGFGSVDSRSKIVFRRFVKPSISLRQLRMMRC